MIVLSLFDGISCGRVALERAGVNIKKYYSSEIDKYAIKISEANYPDIVRLGDVTNWKEWAIDWGSVDLLIGGSPCQGFSFAGKQLAFDDPRSALFFTFVDILSHIKSLNPNVKFLLENVRMKKEHLSVISENLGVEPIMINSALVSAQNRVRFYWANWGIEQPEDKGIVLKSIIQNFSYISQKARGNNKGGNFYRKSPTLTSNSWEHNNFVCSDGWVDWWDKNKDFQESKKYSQLCNDKEKGITLTARMYASWNGNFIKLPGKKKYRKLTPVECERLQTLPDGYTAHVSNSQRYKALGNGWTVDVITHILSTMNIEKKIQERLFA